MRKFHCLCDSELFFGNTHCSACGREVGWCDGCRTMSSLVDGRCGKPECHVPAAPCPNRIQYAVCDCFMLAEGDPAPLLCASCRRTTVIPDTQDPRQVRQWAVMESAKRRLLYDLDLVGLTDVVLDEDPPLEFRFMADTTDEHIATGHANGVITINLAEADPVHREKVRQQFDEPQRTVIGHLRHEFSHFLWMRLVDGRRDAEFKQLFGDHLNPPYADAMPAYYKQGPPADWSSRFISEYASSHPWEDFAETAAFYLDMRSVLDTLAWRAPSLAASENADFYQLLTTYLHAGVALNEVNRTLGLTDLVPEVISTPVADKLRFVHKLVPNPISKSSAT